MKATSERVMQWTLGSALGLVALTALIRPVGLSGAIAGAVLSFVSMALLVRLAQGLFRTSEHRRAGLALLLIAKSGLVLVGAFLALTVLRVDVVGFALGLGALVVGVLGGASHAFLAEPARLEKETTSDA
jgi:hypothetical protein